MKYCSRCRKDKTREEFSLDRCNPDGLTSWCKECAKEYSREYRSRNPSETRRKNRDRGREYKKRFLDMYGRKCACCGDLRELFLTIDHISPRRRQIGEPGGGTGDYCRASSIYRPDLYQVLCMNCNKAKGTASTCPCGGHEQRTIVYEYFRDG